METARTEIEESIREADKILKLPGSFVRETMAKKLPYEAVHPGDWTQFRCRGITAQAFGLMQDREMLEAIEDGSERSRWRLSVRFRQATS